ncbi:MAG: hypothetical protein ACK5Y7_01095, partial [Betaproteobacteria bacterium]
MLLLLLRSSASGAGVRTAQAAGVLPLFGSAAGTVAGGLSPVFGAATGQLGLAGAASGQVRLTGA